MVDDDEDDDDDEEEKISVPLTITMTIIFVYIIFGALLFGKYQPIMTKIHFAIEPQSYHQRQSVHTFSNV